MLKAKSHFVPPPKLPLPTPVVDVGDIEMRLAQDLLFFAYRDFTNVADKVLEELGLGRAHHRALHFIGRTRGSPCRACWPSYALPNSPLRAC
jgi:hypothetical protein